MRKRAANSSVLPVDAEPHREQRGLRSVRELELCEHLAHIALHRSFGEVQHAADLPIALALREQAEYRALALGQERKRTRVRRSAHAVDERTLRLGMQPRLAARDGRERADEVGGYDALDDIARSEE